MVSYGLVARAAPFAAAALIIAIVFTGGRLVECARRTDPTTDHVAGAFLVLCRNLICGSHCAGEQLCGAPLQLPSDPHDSSLCLLHANGAHLVRPTRLSCCVCRLFV